MLLYLSYYKYTLSNTYSILYSFFELLTYYKLMIENIIMF